MWPLSDDALVAGFAAGDAGVAAAFVRRFQSRVFGLAVTMVRDPAVAEEIAQETFTRAWRNAGSYDPRRARVISWLLAITRNLAIDHLRANRPEPLDPTGIVDSERALWTRADAGPDAHPASSGLLAALERLPAEQRRALLLAALCGYTAREIATIEGIPLGTAKTRIRSAMHKLSRLEDSGQIAGGEDAGEGADERR